MKPGTPTFGLQADKVAATAAKHRERAQPRLEAATLNEAQAKVEQAMREGRSTAIIWLPVPMNADTRYRVREAILAAGFSLDHHASDSALVIRWMEEQ